jgi:murein hydrolase activator
LAFLFSVVAINAAQAQRASRKREKPLDRSELEADRQKLAKQIEQTSTQLKSAQQNQTEVRDKLEALQAQIETRELLIQNLQTQVLVSDEIVARTSSVLEALNGDMTHIRTEYALMLRRAYRSKMPQSSWLYMLTSPNFGQAYRRWQYFQQYRKFRKRQTRLILETQRALASKNTVLEKELADKQTLLSSNEEQNLLLSSEKQQKDRLLGSLKEEETRLSRDLKTQERQNEKLNSTISGLIAKELEAKRRASEERRKEAEKLARAEEAKRKKEEKLTRKQDNSAPEATPKKREKPLETLTESSETLALSADFRANKGRLPVPVAGTIVRGFGRQKVLNRVTTDNNGIDIRTQPFADVKAVFSGTVSVVQTLPGLGYVVLVQHGNYFTVYSNLSSIFVQKGQTIVTGQTIARSGLNNVTKEHEVHFELWLERTHLNPSAWLAK